MKKTISELLALRLVAGVIGLAVYYWGFGQTFEGEIMIFAKNEESGAIGLGKGGQPGS